jgi:cephalosporin-C deacetylase-like acetyl esterase
LVDLPVDRLPTYAGRNPRPADRAGRRPAVVPFHGYTGHCGDWLDKLSWVGAGFCIAALDCRGQGGQSVDPEGVSGNTHRGHIIRGLHDGPEHLLFRNIFLDAAQLAGIVLGLPEVDPARVGAFGGSQGGGQMDTICPPSSQFAAFNKIRSGKRVEFYPDYGHENLPGFNEKSLPFMMGM